MLKKIFKPGPATVVGDDAEAQVVGLLRELELAHVMNDAAALDALFAEDFVYYDYTGRALSKAQCLSVIREDEVSYASWDSDEVRVRRYGDTAVITSIETVSVEDGGHEVAGRFRLTLVLVKELGDWRVVVGHETQMSAPVSNKR